MYSNWSTAAQHQIAEAVATLPDGAALADRKRLLRERAYHFHGGTSWGKKIWGRECRKHLEVHGQPPRRVVDAAQPTFADDIVFPFRAAQ